MVAKRILLPLLFFVLASNAFAQQARQYVFRHLSTANGLSSNIITSILQDHRGYMWMGSNNGLQRYDGTTFLSFNRQPGNIHPFPNDYVGLLYEDAHRRFWVGTGDNKLGLFDTRTFKFTEVPVKWRNRNNIYINKRLTEIRGELLIITQENGMYMYDSVASEFKQVSDFIPAPAGWSVNSIIDDKKSGKMWISCAQGVVMYDPATKHLNYRGHNPDNDPFINWYQHFKSTHWLTLDKNRRLSFITWEPGKPGPYICVFDLTTNRGHDYNLHAAVKIGYHEVFGPLVQRNGRVWFHGYPFIAEFTGDTARPFLLVRNEYTNETSIKFDRVDNLYEDREQNLWAASDNGLYIFNPDAEVFKNYTPQHYNDKPAEVAVQAVLKTQSGTMWVGTWGGGLYFYDKEMNPIPPPPGLDPKQAPMVWNIKEQRDGKRVWLGLQDGRLLVYDNEKKKGTYLEPPILQKSTVRELVEDQQGNMWIGTQRGLLIKWDRKASGDDPTKGYSLVMKEGLQHRLFCDKQGYIWAGCQGYGLARIDATTGAVLNRYNAEGAEGKRLYENTPHDIIQLNDSMFVVSTGALNVLNVRSGDIKIYTTQQGLPSNTVFGLVQDRSGYIWMGLANGLCRMNLEKNLFTLYDRRDGITYDNFAAIGAGNLPDGRIVFPSDHNFLMFDPERMQQSSAPRNVVITSFNLENQPQLVDSLLALEDVALDYDRTSITIGFSSLIYLNPDKLTYYYQLEGQDEEWIKADKRQEAVYNYLPPGHYTFKVKSQNSDGVFSSDVTTVHIHVNAPFWRTWWFYGALTLLATGILYWIDRERIKRIMGVQKVRSQIAANLHAAVNTTLNNINLLSEMAKMKADKDITLSKEYIEQISEKSREMIDAMDDVLWSIQPENDSMQKTLLRMQEFSDGLQSSHGVIVKMAVDDNIAALTLDMKIRQDIYFLFKDALNYISQYAEGTIVLVNMDLVKSRFLLKIHAGGPFTVVEAVADQRYFEAMQQRAAQLPALLDIQADKRGISIILQVPVK